MMSRRRWHPGRRMDEIGQLHKWADPCHLTRRHDHTPWSHAKHRRDSRSTSRRDGFAGRHVARCRRAAASRSSMLKHRGTARKYLLTVPKRTFRRSRRLRLPLTKRPRLRHVRVRRAVQNKYVTNADSRMTNARTPTSHASSHVGGGSDAIAVATVNPAASPACFRPHGQRF